MDILYVDSMFRVIDVLISSITYRLNSSAMQHVDANEQSINWKCV